MCVNTVYTYFMHDHVFFMHDHVFLCKESSEDTEENPSPTIAGDAKQNKWN